MIKHDFLARSGYRLRIPVSGSNTRWLDMPEFTSKLPPIRETRLALVDFVDCMVAVPPELEGKLSFRDVLRLANTIKEFEEVAP